MGIYQIKKEDIIEAVKVCLKISNKINPNKQLVSTAYHILLKLFVDNNKYVILEAPTGSGKTIIGFIVFFCVQYLNEKKKNKNLISNDGRIHTDDVNAYYLTSAKILQEQIEQDLDRFEFHDWINILKGQANYDCPKGTKQNFEKNGIKKLTKENFELFSESYKTRICVDTKPEDRSRKEHEDYCEYHDKCPYMVARNTTSASSCGPGSLRPRMPARRDGRLGSRCGPA